MLHANAEGRLVSQGGLMLVVSMSLGGVLGEWLDLELKLERFAVANMLPSLVGAVVWSFLESALNG